MHADEIAWLRSPEGAAAVAETERLLVAGAGELRALEQLRARQGVERARAVLALIEGRRAAAGKFVDAARLYLDRSAAEQATPEAVSVHIAARFAGSRLIADLGCGAGADSLALAVQAPVLAVDRDESRLAMLRANAAIRGLADRIATLKADVETLVLPAAVDAAWLDPGRRDERGRVFDPRRWAPSFDVALRLARGVPAAGIKVAPGIDLALVPGSAEIEFVSLRGALAVAVIWLGDAVTAPRRATVLPAGASLAGSEEQPAERVQPPGRYLYDPDPAIGRAGLVRPLAERLGAWQIDASIAYLSGDEARDTPFARRFRVERALPFSERRLIEVLRALGPSRVEVMRRGSPVDANALERRLNRALPPGERVVTVALTRAQGEHVVIVGERER